MDGHEQVGSASGEKLTYDDFLRFPDDGLRHELIDGEHYVTPSPVTVHQRLVGELYLALAGVLRSTARGEVFLAPFDVVLSHYDIVEPDLLVVLADQADIVTDKHVRGAPAIVVEILSPGTRRRDETLKRDLYARFGVREYWMVDADRRALRVCRWQAGSESVAYLAANVGNILTTELLPELELELELSGLFARVYRDSQ